MIYTTNLGRMYTGNCQEILANDLEILKGKVNLIFTSPPFPLNRAKKYGNMTGDEYLEFLSFSHVIMFLQSNRIQLVIGYNFSILDFKRIVNTQEYSLKKCAEA